MPAGDTWTEKHRHECEVRYVAAMRSRSRIKAYVDGVAKVRGEEAANRLWNDFVRLVKK